MIQFNEYKSPSYWLARSRRNRIANAILLMAFVAIVLICIYGGV